MNQKSLRIVATKKDILLSNWISVVKAKQDRGLLSFLAKQAIIYYVNNNQFLCIGKIYVKELEKQESINLNIDSVTPEVKKWFSDIKNNNIKLGTMLKSVLEKSIIPVNTKEEEWIPTYFDINMVISRKGNAVMPIETQSIPVSVFDRQQMTVTSTPKNETAYVTSVTTAHTIEDKAEVKKEVQKETKVNEKISRMRAGGLMAKSRHGK